MSEARPLLVLVGGPAGAGKTTLARHLSDQMGLVHLGRDNVKSAIAATDAGRSTSGLPQFDAAKGSMGGEYGQRAFATAYAAVRTLLEGGASVVLDQAWRAGRSEAELRPLLEVGRTVLITVVVAPEVAGERARGRGHREGLAPLTEVLARAAEDHEEFINFDLGVPRLSVDTTDGYDPPLTEVEAWIWRTTA